MSQGKIVIATEEVLNAAGKIRGFADDYKAEYVKLYDIVESMAELGIWVGADNVAYTKQIEGFKNDFKKMEELVRSYADFLEKASRGYKAVQNNITNQVDKKLEISV